jgi:hypothetical protein
MGRPLNKKFFGNRNIGRNGREGTTKDMDGIGRSHYSEGEGTMHSVPAGDDGIGGEGLANVVFGASVADTSYGSGAYLNKIPHITTIQKPTLPGGVQAVADVVTVKAVHGVVNQAGTPNGAGQDYRSGDILTVMTGSPTTPAKFTVGALKVSGFTIVSGNSGQTTEGYAVGDALNFANGVVLTVATIDGTGGYPANRGVVTSLTLTNAGSYFGSTPPTGTVGQSIPDQVGGRGLTVNFSWGVRDVTVLVAGVYPIVAGSANTTSVTHADLSASTAAGCTLDIFYGVNTIQVTEKGSGYIGTETVTFTDRDAGLSETRATGTIVLTQDTGLVGSATNQENAIIARVFYDGVVQIADIIKQQNARSYVVIVQSDPADPEYTDKDDEPVLAKLVNHVPVDNAPPDAEYAPVKEMTIRATDDNGNTYFVTKLTAHKARLWRDTNNESEWLFANGESARWTFGNAQAGERKSVQIENA